MDFKLVQVHLLEQWPRAGWNHEGEAGAATRPWVGPQKAWSVASSQQCEADATVCILARKKAEAHRGKLSTRKPLPSLIPMIYKWQCHRGLQ